MMTVKGESMNTVHVTMRGTALTVVASAPGKPVVSKVLRYANASAASAGLANLVKGAEAQRATVNVTIH
jgi:hypothetical protein